MKFFIFFLSVASIYAQNSSSIINSAVEKDKDKFVAIFKDLHQNPELGFNETRTAGIVAKELKAYGYEVTEGIAKTGVAGVLKNGEGPIVMYRAIWTPMRLRNLQIYHTRAPQ
ncbi:hypothetical protein [Jejuia pallidilutea]|uniref:hypothetical protein n=1 Tax=Jejuia pallidilutea TaxID=504487 RepID=UPI00126A6188|nr:hypothetical protein [Jejuia pallidilutea]